MRIGMLQHNRHKKQHLRVNSPGEESTLPTGAYGCAGLLGGSGPEALCRGCLRYLLRELASHKMAPPARYIGRSLYCPKFLRA